MIVQRVLIREHSSCSYGDSTWIQHAWAPGNPRGLKPAARYAKTAFAPAIVIAIAITILIASTALAQTASLGARHRQTRKGRIASVPLREDPRVRPNPVYHRYSWISQPPRKPKTYKVGDLITIVVRERRTFEAEADLETKKQFDIQSQLDALFKITQQGVGSSDFRRGKPNVSYKFDQRLKSEADAEREDSLTTRITGKIIDVKPNGLLVLEARARIEHDEEASVITLTGTCRKEDVTADNTVLSTQVADKNITVSNEGALRAASTRGWIQRILDWVKPI